VKRVSLRKIIILSSCTKLSIIKRLIVFVQMSIIIKIIYCSSFSSRYKSSKFCCFCCCCWLNSSRYCSLIFLYSFSKSSTCPSSAINKISSMVSVSLNDPWISSKLFSSSLSIKCNYLAKIINLRLGYMVIIKIVTVG
jgi:hypothetical protein